MWSFCKNIDSTKNKNIMTFQFKIQIKNIKKPPVWRRVVVPADISFKMFHYIIQEAFGWLGIHLYAFSPEGYGSEPWIEGDDEYNDISASEESISANTILLSEVFDTEGETFTYIYDYGDDWIHNITLEKIDRLNIAPTAKLLAGKGTCPPEDCGGAWGYQRLKEVLADKNHPEFENYKEWLFGDEEMLEDSQEDEAVWDPDDFDLEFEKEWFDGLFKIISLGE